MTNVIRWNIPLYYLIQNCAGHFIRTAIYQNTDQKPQNKMKTEKLKQATKLASNYLSEIRVLIGKLEKNQNIMLNHFELPFRHLLWFVLLKCSIGNSPWYKIPVWL